MKNFNLNAFGLALVLLTACGPKSPDRNARSNSPVEETEFVGSAADALKEVQASQYQSKCDIAINDVKSKIVKFISQKPKKMKFSSKAATDDTPTATLLPFAKSSLANLPKQNGKDAWSPETISWTTLNAKLEQKKGTVSNSELWFYANSEARSLIYEDRKRILGSINYGLNHSTVPFIAAIQASVDDCDAKASCVNPGFSDDALAVIKEVPFYQEFQDKITQEPDASKKRSILHDFKFRLDLDAQVNVPKFNPTLALTHDEHGNHYSLAIDATKFSTEDQSLIKGTIEAIWNSSENDLTLTFQAKTAANGLYEILFHSDQPNQRPMTDWKEMTLNLYPYTLVRSIAHEFGHVLGFTDHYYTSFDETKCEYTQESNGGDIMSKSSSGVVTGDEWKALSDFLNVPKS